MYQCNYCKRYLKQKYEHCPGCGANIYTKVSSYSEQIIKTPPKGGYKINIVNYKYKNNFFIIPIFVIIYTVFSFVIFGTIYLSISNSLEDSETIFKIIPVIFISLAFLAFFKLIYTISKEVKKEKNKINDNIKRVEKLKEHGILIKNLPYELKEVKENNNYGKIIYKIKVIFEIEKGKTLSLESEPKYLTALGRENGTVDVLIDPDDYDNYFIDFEIY